MAEEEKQDTGGAKPPTDKVAGAFSDLAKTLVAALGTGAGVLTVVAATGAGITWARLSAVGAPADQALVVLTRKELIAAGAMTLALFVFLGLLAVALVYAIDGHGRPTSQMRAGLILIVVIQVAVTPWVVDAAPGVQVEDRGWLVVVGMFAFALAVLPPLSSDRRERRRREAEKRDEGPATPATELVSEVRVEDATTVGWFGETRTFVRKTSRPLPPQAPPAAKPVRSRFRERLFAGLATALLLSTAALVYDDEVIAGAVALAAALGFICFGIAESTGTRFWPYGLSVFFSVLIFGSAFSVAQLFQTPLLSPVGLVRSAPDEQASGLVGLLVARDGDTVWLSAASLDCRDGAAEGKNAGIGGRGRVFSVPADAVIDLEIGAPTTLPRADAQARALLREVIRRQPVATRAKLLWHDGHHVAPRRLERPRETEAALDAKLTRYVRTLRPPAVSPCRRLAAKVDVRPVGRAGGWVLDATASGPGATRFRWDGGAVSRGRVVTAPDVAEGTIETVTLTVDTARRETARAVVSLIGPEPVTTLFSASQTALSTAGRQVVSRYAAGLAGARRVYVSGPRDEHSRASFRSAVRTRAVIAALRADPALAGARIERRPLGDHLRTVRIVAVR